MITSWTGTKLAEITNGTWHNDAPHAPAMGVEIDHRLLGGAGLFVALKGEQRDGHDFLPELKTINAPLSAM